MNYQDFIGFKLNEVINFFKQNKIDYEVVYIDTNKLNYDNLLVTNIKLINYKVKIYVDRFLLQI